MRQRKRKHALTGPREEWLYGRQAVREALKARRRDLFGLHVREGHGIDERDEAMSALIASAGVNVSFEDARWFERTLGSVHHQNMALRTGPYPYRDFKELLSEIEAGDEPGFWLLLDHVQDPQNLGSLIRTADAVGVHGLLLPKDRAAGVTPAAVRASAGASEHVAVCRVVNIVQSMETLKKAQVWLTGLEATPDAKLYTELDYACATGLVLGGEGRGLSRLARERCDWLARLPMFGKVESLNAGVAGAIAMYEVARQRAQPD